MNKERAQVESHRPASDILLPIGPAVASMVGIFCTLKHKLQLRLMGRFFVV